MPGAAAEGTRTASIRPCAALLTRLDLVARRDVARSPQLCGVDAEDIADMIAEIRGLTPKPGLPSAPSRCSRWCRRVRARVGPDGGWLVELNSDTLPRLLVNSRYYAKVSAGARDKDAKNYLTECLNNANWLVKSLDQRARTILKVASEIVRQQDGFLTYGVRHLRPLNLRTIADAIGDARIDGQPRHLEQIHRHAARSVRAEIFLHRLDPVGGRRRIALRRSGARPHPRNDRERGAERDSLRRPDCRLLTADGVNIARRTVAKYREAMRIPSSVERRRLKSIQESAGAAFR